MHTADASLPMKDCLWWFLCNCCILHSFALICDGALQVRPLSYSRNLLLIDGTATLYPRRTLLLPATYLLPRSLSVKLTIKVGVNGPLETGKVRGSIDAI